MIPSYPVRFALALLVLVACDPAPGPFRPRPPRPAGSLACMRLPRRPPDAPLPQVNLDFSSDGENDYVVARPGTCDADGNCDRDVYFVRESCAVMAGTVRARVVKSSGSTLLAIERVMIDGQPVERETRYWTDASEHYRRQGAPACRLEGTTEPRSCEGERPPEEPHAR